MHVAEQERTPGHSELAEAVARQLFKLMAYKDEYEVARLHLDAVERAKLGAEFGEDAAHLLHAAPAAAARARPEAQAEARAAGSCRRSGCCYRMRRLRGTRLDPFGPAKVRRVERTLITEYEALVAEALTLLTPDTHDTAVELLELPDVIRGYEEIKLRNVVLYRKRADALLKRLQRDSLTASPSTLSLS